MDKFVFFFAILVVLGCGVLTFTAAGSGERVATHTVDTVAAEVEARRPSQVDQAIAASRATAAARDEGGGSAITYMLLASLVLGAIALVFTKGGELLRQFRLFRKQQAREERRPPRQLPTITSGLTALDDPSRPRLRDGR